MALLAGPAWAQLFRNTGEPDPEKTQAEIAAEKAAERAYRRSLGNIPEQKSSDPWGACAATRAESGGQDSAGDAKARRAESEIRRHQAPTARQNRHDVPGAMPGQ